MPAKRDEFTVLLVLCRDEKGLLYRISKALLDRGANVIENGEYVDRNNGLFFMRTAFSGQVDGEALRQELARVLPAESQISLKSSAPKSLVLLATREAHCLGDLLLRHDSGLLNARILSVVSQYDHLEGLVRKFGLPFHCVPAEGLDRPTHEARVSEILSRYPFDYMVLAKYMRILTPEFVGRYTNRIVNIHHSFLPAFVGRNPYQQAYERGVKILGATAHFVNGELDEGPIIAQSVIPTHHSQDAQAMAHAGRDVEKIVLARALELVLDDRVIVQGKRTVVFS